MPTTEEFYESCLECGEVMDMGGIQIFSPVACSACGFEFMARSRIGEFQILELIAEGGTATVYKAVEESSGREVALKVMKEEACHEIQARAIADIDHPNIVRIFEIGHAQGRFFLAMEFLGGGSLDDLLQERGPIDEALVVGVGIQVAEGLSAAFARGLLHRDIKPANILFTHSGTAKLVDFGLSVQPLGEVWGTPDHIAPEKLAEQPEDFRSDIYSLGSTLFHALKGHPPYKTDNLPLADLRELKKNPVYLRSSAPGVTDETFCTIHHMMKVDPAKRPASHGELIKLLRQALSALKGGDGSNSPARE
jgi:serine/threonine protein kinase